MMAFLKAITFLLPFCSCAVPVVSSDTSEVVAPTNWPKPRTVVTLRILAMAAKPPVSLPMTFSLWPRSLSMLTAGLPKSTPRSAMCATSSITAATCSKALDGNATHVQTHATQGGVALDDDHVQAEVGRAERCRVTAGATAQDEHIALRCRHEPPKVLAGCGCRGCCHWGCRQRRALRNRCGNAGVRMCAAGAGQPQRPRFQHQHHRALLDLVAQLDFQLLSPHRV
jgi:hypothetical protein